MQPFKLQTRNVRGQGAEPLAFSWGSKGAILSCERMTPFPVQRQRRCHPSARRAEKRAEALRLVSLLMLCERHGNDAISLFLEAHDDHALRGSARRADGLHRRADEDTRARDEQQILAAVHDLDADDAAGLLRDNVVLDAEADASGARLIKKRRMLASPSVSG